MKDIIEKGIEAILPVYIKDRGNCTVVYTKEDRIIIEKTSKTVITNLCKYYHLDLRASNKAYGDLLTIKKHPPIPFTYDQIFIPMKTRKPIARHDGAYGYVNMESINKISKSKIENNTLIYISKDRPIEVYSRLCTIQRNINNGEIVKRLFRRSDLVREVDSLYMAEDTLATKKDIAMVYKEIMELKKGL
ncbi:MAG: competence protein ComK [Tissierellaceae bacterium]|nr:competence protein ComK [Tissierellaceae bacterium]